MSQHNFAEPVLDSEYFSPVYFLLTFVIFCTLTHKPWNYYKNVFLAFPTYLLFLLTLGKQLPALFLHTPCQSGIEFGLTFDFVKAYIRYDIHTPSWGNDASCLFYSLPYPQTFVITQYIRSTQIYKINALLLCIACQLQIKFPNMTFLSGFSTTADICFLSIE